MGPWAPGRVLALPATLHPLRLGPPPPRAAPALPPPDLAGGVCGDLAQALAMLHALPGALRACLLEAARLCGSGAGGAQANLLSMHWASQARTSWEDLVGFRVQVDAASMCAAGGRAPVRQRRRRRAGQPAQHALSVPGALHDKILWEVGFRYEVSGGV